MSTRVERDGMPNYHRLYRLGLTPWEGYRQAAAGSIDALLDRALTRSGFAGETDAAPGPLFVTAQGVRRTSRISAAPAWRRDPGNMGNRTVTIRGRACARAGTARGT